MITPTFGLDDCKVALWYGDGSYGTAVDIPSVQLLSPNTKVQSAQLIGDDKVTAVSSMVIGNEIKLRFGSMSLFAAVVLFGWGKTTSVDQESITVESGQQLPIFGIVGRAMGTSGGDLHIWIPKVKVTSDIQYGVMEYGKFSNVEITGYATNDDTYELINFIEHATITPLAIPPTVPTSSCPPDNNLHSTVNNIALINSVGEIYRTGDFQSSTPTWVRDSTIFTNTVYDVFSSKPFYTAKVNQYSPVYVGDGSTISLYITNKSAIYKIDDIFGTPTITRLHVFTQQTYSEFRAIGVSNCKGVGEYPTIIGVVSSYKSFGTSSGGDGISYIYSTDGGNTWSNEVYISTKTDHNIHGHGVANRPGLHISSKIQGLVYTSIFYYEPSTLGDDSASLSRGVYSLDYGETWNTYELIDGVNNTSVLHVPWDDNDLENLIYYSAMSRTTGGIETYGIKRSNGTTVADITPTVSGVTYGPYMFDGAIDTFSGDNSKVIMCARGNGIDTSSENTQTNGKGATFISSDGGDTWSNIITPANASPNHLFPHQAAFSKNSSNHIFIWGNEGYIKFTTNFGSAILDKEGNLGSLTYVGEEVLCIVGGE